MPLRFLGCPLGGRRNSFLHPSIRIRVVVITSFPISIISTLDSANPAVSVTAFGAPLIMKRRRITAGTQYSRPPFAIANGEHLLCARLVACFDPGQLGTAESRAIPPS